MKMFFIMLIAFFTIFITTLNVQATPISNKLPAPIANHHSGSTIGEDDQIILSVPQAIPGAIVVMSALDPSSVQNVTWNPCTTFPHGLDNWDQSTQSDTIIYNK